MSGKQFSTLLKDFPASDSWRLVIDGYRQNTEGPLAFEYNTEEIGYLEGVLNALDLATNTISTKKNLTAHVICDIHDITMASLKLNPNLLSGNTEEEISYQQEKYQRSILVKQGLRNNIDVNFGLTKFDPRFSADKYNYSAQGIKNIYDRVLTDEKTTLGKPRLQLLDFNNQPLKNFDPHEEDAENILYKLIQATPYHIRLGEETKEELLKDMDSKLSDFYHDMSSINDDNEKINRIAALIHELELCHYFADANCRTVLVVLNTLLMQQGLTPVILQNPNHADAYSVHEFSEKIREGMREYKKYLITDLKQYIDHHAVDMLNNPEKFKTDLVKRLASDCYTALAQINSLIKYVQEKQDHELTFTKKSCLDFFSKKICVKKSMVHDLNSIYQKKFNQILMNMNNSEEIKSLYRIIERHDGLANDTVSRCQLQMEHAQLEMKQRFKNN